jgi:prolyl-tRNA synthetase
VTEASGGAFTEKLSYEFMVLTDAGEDDILYCDACEFCVNDQITDLEEGALCSSCQNGMLTQARASEVGDVFDLGTKYGRDFDMGFIARDGSKQFPVMGCYGIGISRLMGVIVEKFHDERGIIWPSSIAPARVHLVQLGSDEAIRHAAMDLYERCRQRGIEVLWDDRDASAGVKLADADLIGIPWRIVVSARMLKQDRVELKSRVDEPEILTVEQALSRVV